jgi:hypothetical protein
MPQPAYNNLCWLQVESDEARRHLYFHWSVNISGSPICSALFFKLIFKNNYNFFICIIVCSDTINKIFGNESYFKNFNYRGESPNVTPNKDWWRRGRKLPQRHSHHLSQSARLIIICRLGTCVRSRVGVDVKRILIGRGIGYSFDETTPLFINCYQDEYAQTICNTVQSHFLKT